MTDTIDTIDTAGIVAAICKPLAWQDARISGKWPRFYAESCFGGYEALEWSDGTFGGSVPSGVEDEPNVEFSAVSLSAAQAAAEQDYRARIAADLDVEKIVTLVGAGQAVRWFHERGLDEHAIEPWDALPVALAAFKEASHG